MEFPGDWSAGVVTAASVVLGSTGLSAVFAAGTYDAASEYRSRPDPPFEAELLAQMHQAWVERYARFDGIFFEVAIEHDGVTEVWPELATNYTPWAQNWTRPNSAFVRGLAWNTPVRPTNGVHSFQ